MNFVMRIYNIYNDFTMSDGRSFFLQPGTRYTVGRQPGCDVLVQDQHASALHCYIWAKEETSGEKPAESSDHTTHDCHVQGSGDIHGDNAPHGGSDTHGDNAAHGGSDTHGDNAAHGDSDTHGYSNDVAYVVDLSRNGTWLKRKDASSSSSSAAAARRIAKKESIPLRYGDTVYLKSPLSFPAAASCPLEVQRCEERVCVAASTSDVSNGIIQFVRQSDGGEQVDNTGKGTEEVCGDCSPSPKRARCNGDNETTTVPAADKWTTEQSQFECCPVCMQLVPISDFLEHARNCASDEGGRNATGSQEHGETERNAVEQCQFCWNVFILSDLVSHVPSCPARSSSDRDDFAGAVTSSLDAGGEVVERCMYCFRDFPLSKLVVHAEKCKGDMLGETRSGRFKAFLPSVHDLDALSLSVLTPTQQAAVEYVVGQSQSAAAAVESRLLERVMRMGYTESDLQRTFNWVRNEAPVIIHLNLTTVLEHLVHDTHYRNLFEVGEEGGTTHLPTRARWEDKIFNSIYHDSPPEERVKYGVLNIVGDIRGVKACYCYGDSFLQLKKVRLRTTFASADTSFDHVKLACCEHYANVLYEYSNSELKAILDVATSRQPWADSGIISNYKEVQIHGPVCLSENVDCIVVNSRFRRDTRVRELLKEFVQRNGCNMIWMDAAESVSDAGSSLEGVTEEVGSLDRRWWEDDAYYSSYDD